MWHHRWTHGEAGPPEAESGVDHSRYIGHVGYGVGFMLRHCCNLRQKGAVFVLLRATVDN